MATGLREIWNLRPAQNGKLSHEAQAFKAGFQGRLAEINSALQYTAVHADRDWQGDQIAKREKLVADYQVVIAKFNSDTVGAAQRDADLVLGSAKSLAVEIAAAKGDVEGSAAEWESVQPTYDDAVATVKKMEDAGGQKAVELRSQLSDIRKHANKKDYKAAVRGTKQLGNTRAAATEDAPASTPPASGETPPTKKKEKLVTNRGLQTLYLTSYSRSSTRNLAKLLAAEDSNQVVTLAICPFFDKTKADAQEDAIKKKEKADKKKGAVSQGSPKLPGSKDLYKNVKTVIRRVTHKGKKIGLTIFLGFQNETSDLVVQSDLLGRFLTEPLTRKTADTFLSVLHSVAISPKLEDKYLTEVDGHKTAEETISGKKEPPSSFEKAVQTIADNLPLAVLTAPNVEFRRSVGGQESKESRRNDKDPNGVDPKNKEQLVTFVKDDVTYTQNVTHEYHHTPSDSKGYQVYASDGPLVYSPDVEGKNSLGDKPLPGNPPAQTIDQFIAEISKLPPREQVMLWRPSYNLQAHNLDSKGIVTEYPRSPKYDRDDEENRGFSSKEQQIAAKFLGIDLDEKKRAKTKSDGADKAGSAQNSRNEL